MVFFLAFLTLPTIILPAFPPSQVGQLLISLTFALTLVFGSSATIRHRISVYLVIGLTVTTFAADQIADFVLPCLQPLATVLKLACLSILLFMTLKRVVRPGRITGCRVIGGIAGYLLIGYTWALAYQVLQQTLPGAIHFEPDSVADNLSRQPGNLVYFSFTTLTTVGYGDVHPVHAIARSLAVAEALVGQLYLAILIASLVGMALQARSAKEVEEP